MTIKVTGHQWYWEYSYPDNGNVDIESRYIHDEDLKPEVSYPSARRCWTISWSFQ